MTATFGLALLLQVICIAALRHRLGHGWLRRPAVVLVLGSVLSQGLAPALLSIPSVGQQDYFRQGIAPQWYGRAALAMSVTLLAFTVGYLLAFPERAAGRLERDDTARAAAMLDWRLLALACAPLAAATAQGRGYNSGTATGQGTALSASLAATFLVIIAVAAAAAFLLRHGGRWLLPVL